MISKTKEKMLISIHEEGGKLTVSFNLEKARKVFMGKFIKLLVLIVILMAATRLGLYSMGEPELTAPYLPMFYSGNLMIFFFISYLFINLLFFQIYKKVVFN